MSDVPIRYSPAVRQRMLAARKIKSPLGYFSLLSGLSVRFFHLFYLLCHFFFFFCSQTVDAAL